jgi:hypothetical protein
VSKPPTQSLGVSGIEPRPVNTPDPQPSPFTWQRLAEHPPFQMFILTGRFLIPYEAPGDDDVERVMRFLRAQDEGALRLILEDYKTWHAAKGYWPGESAVPGVGGV